MSYNPYGVHSLHTRTPKTSFYVHSELFKLAEERLQEFDGCEEDTIMNYQ